MSATFDAALVVPLAVIAAIVVLLPSPAQAGGDATRGAQRFQECAACHKLEPGVAGLGPSLRGVIERKAAALADFRYSPALKRSGLTWNVDTLDAFLADPQKLVPANRMPFAGLPDAEDRADIIAYLRNLAP
jgi:cytochrome c2